MNSKAGLLTFLLGLACLTVVLLNFSDIPAAHANSNGKNVPAPEFTHTQADRWINSEPLSLADLRGKVVLMDVWTFGCWNCYRSFPWMKELEAKFADQDFTVIGIHTPEFDHERDRNQVMAKVKEFGLEHPVMLDNDFSYWKALNNQYWPTFYLVDKQGRIRDVFIGETHSGDSNAVAIEKAVTALLAE